MNDYERNILAAINALCKLKEFYMYLENDVIEGVEFAIDALKQLLKINIFDKIEKIETEIETYRKYCEENTKAMSLNNILQIIEKYKKECKI